jgi:hypothetical protein
VLLKSYTKIFIFICSSSEDETSKKDKYEQKGVDEEKGLRKLIDSEDESEDEEKKVENNEKEVKTKKGLIQL